MSLARIGARGALAALAALASVALMAAPSWATGGTVLCIKPGSAALAANSNGTCPSPYKATLLGAEGTEGKQGPEGKEGKEGKQGPEGQEGKLPLTPEEEATLKGILPCIKSVSKGIAGKPTVQFSGCNVQIVNGEGKTASANGGGNLVIGYDETESGDEQTGSHNLILGRDQTFTSWGGIVDGVVNTISGEFASVTGGAGNRAEGFTASVSGGVANTARGLWSSVSGGRENTAAGGVEAATSVSGGKRNMALSELSSVSGGEDNIAEGERSSISGGFGNTTFAYAWAGGGYKNNAANRFVSIFGGKELGGILTKEYEAIP